MPEPQACTCNCASTQITSEISGCNISSACSKTSYSNRVIDPIPEEQEVDTVLGQSEQGTVSQGIREVAFFKTTQLIIVIICTW